MSGRTVAEPHDYPALCAACGKPVRVSKGEGYYTVDHAAGVRRSFHQACLDAKRAGDAA